MFYVTKTRNVISDADMKRVQQLSGKCVAYSIKSMSSFGRRKKYYLLKLQRIKRDRDRILAEHTPVWEEVAPRKETC